MEDPKYDLGFGFDPLSPKYPKREMVDSFFAGVLPNWRDDPQLIQRDLKQFCNMSGLSGSEAMFASMHYIFSNHMFNANLLRFSLANWIELTVLSFPTLDVLSKPSLHSFDREKQLLVMQLLKGISISKEYSYGVIKIGGMLEHHQRTTAFHTMMAQLFHVTPDPDKVIGRHRDDSLLVRCNLGLSGAIMEATNPIEIPDDHWNYFSRGVVHTVHFAKMIAELTKGKEAASHVSRSLLSSIYLSIGLLLRTPR